MKILIADDDPQILRALSITFTASDYDIGTGVEHVRLVLRPVPRRSS